MARKKKVIELPKGYLSYSQCQMWKTNKDRYIKKYIELREDLNFDNQSMKYGKVVADALENEVHVEDALTDTMMFMLKKYDIRDKEDVVEFKTDFGWLTLFFKPDTFDSVTKDFREYKTGKVKWTQGKAEKHFQLKFYALCIYLKYKHITDITYLDWIETEDYNDMIRPTGKLTSFKVCVGIKTILETLKEVIEIAKEIETVYLTHKKEALW